MSKKHHSSSTYMRNKKRKDTERKLKIIAFFLFIAIFMLNISICGFTTYLSSKEFEKVYTNQNYVNSIYLDVKQYAYDICEYNSVPKDSVDLVVNYDTISNINEVYVLGNLGGYEDYTSTTYQNKLSAFNDDLITATNDMITNLDLSVNDSDSVQKFASDITDYLKGIVEIKYISQLKTVTNAGKLAFIVLAVISAILTLVLVLSTLLVSNKKYRGIRAISYSVIATALLDSVLILAAEIVKKTKSLVFYPSYLCSATMDYINDSIFKTGLSVLMLVAIALVLITFAWKMKRDEK